MCTIFVEDENMLVGYFLQCIKSVTAQGGDRTEDDEHLALIERVIEEALLRKREFRKKRDRHRRL